MRWRNWGPEKGDYNSENLPIVEDMRPERFAFQWWIETNNPTTVEFEFLEHEEGTLVKLKESGYENSDEAHARFADCCAGWGSALTLLKFYCEHGIVY